MAATQNQSVQREPREGQQKEKERGEGKQNTKLEGKKKKVCKYPREITQKRQEIGVRVCVEIDGEKKKALQDNALEFDFTTTAETSRNTFDIKPVSIAEIT